MFLCVTCIIFVFQALEKILPESAAQQRGHAPKSRKRKLRQARLHSQTEIQKLAAENNALKAQLAIKELCREQERQKMQNEAKVKEEELLK